ncbi:uncharacterized protein LOC121370710 [Gigantopelta aegis]|uniref:uncharacterized protein LOC121370710 n=1 Tax=Gigantopelta aegis TaxID=1735272 RepID=UPI001B887A34|nr:uncharacterized protein LOC121370710 [Gigantopelta aegis]XP_041352057.1 uncharacterized protein LOC121370710 [Gigantopelta aegis]
MPSTRSANTPSRRTSSRRTPAKSPKIQSTKHKASKSDNSNGSKSCTDVSTDISMGTKPTAGKVSAVTTRRRRSENSDVETPVPVKRSKQQCGAEIQTTPAKQQSACVSSNSKPFPVVDEDRKTQNDDDNIPTNVNNKDALGNVDDKNDSSKNSLRGLKKNSVDEVQVSTEAPEIQNKDQSMSSSVDAEVGKYTKRGRPANQACLKEQTISNVGETSINKPENQLEAKSAGSAEVKPEDISSVNKTSPVVDFSPRRSGRAMVPNRRYLEIEDHMEKKKTKKGTGSRKTLQKEPKTSPDSSSKSHIPRTGNAVVNEQKQKTENTEHLQVPKSTVTIGDNNKGKISQVVWDNKATGNVGTLQFSKHKDVNVSVCSLNFKKTSDVVSSKETVPSNTSDKTERLSCAILESSVLSPVVGKQIIDAKSIPQSQTDSEISVAEEEKINKLEVSSNSSLPTSVLITDSSSMSTTSRQTAGLVSSKTNKGKEKNNQTISQNVVANKVITSQTCVVVSKDVEADEPDTGDSVSIPAARVATSTNTCSRGDNLQSTLQRSVVNEDKKGDVRPSGSPKAAVMMKRPIVHVRRSSGSRPPREIQTQTIYKVNLDGTSTRTVIILDRDDISTKGKSLLKPQSSKNSVDLQREYVEKKEKELASTGEPKGSQTDEKSSGDLADLAASVLKEVSAESSRTINLVENSSAGGNQGLPTTPGKIQKATTRQNIPDVSDHLTPFIKIISFQSDDHVDELSPQNTGDDNVQIVEPSSISERRDPRVLKMDARTKRAVASILSLESGITFSSPPSTTEETTNSSYQERLTGVMTTSTDACTDKSVVLPISQTSSSETLTIQSFGEDTSKPISRESSQMNMTAEASNKTAPDPANPSDGVEQENNSDFTALWSDILETNAVTSGSISETGSGDQSKSKYVTSSTQTPIEPAEEKIIVPSVYKSSVIDVSHIKKECVDEDDGGGKNKQTLVVVRLPEGAVVTQPVVQTRYKYDDAPFLDENYLDIFRCKICCYETKKKANWYKHKQKHLGLRPHACDQCQYRAATASNLKRHLAIHADIRNFMCQICGMYFRQKIHLERHIKYKHEVKQVKCPLCEYVCANENPDLKVHIKRKHFTGELMESSLKAFTCSECNLIALSKKDLRQHMKFHKQGPELKLFCEHCSFVTDCDSRLRRHMFIHTKEKPFQCGMCEYRGSQKEHVLRHMRNVHDIEIHRRQRKQAANNQLIEGGQISMAALSKLIDRNDYTCRDKIFACNHCSMKFSKLLNLYKHLYTQHENIMPPQKDDEFGCVVCEFQTNTKKNLLVHMRKHNMHDHNPPSHVYSCVLCRYQNPKRRNLFQHMKKKHHIEIVMKEDGTTSCFIEDSSTLPDDLDQNLMTVGDIVTTTTSNFDSEGDESEYKNVISIQNFASLVAPQPTAINDGEGNLIIDTEISSIQDIQTSHTDAAEAIEGLQALSQQTRVSGVVEVMGSDDQTVTLLDQPTVVMNESRGIEEFSQEEKQSIQLTADQLVNLSSGDYVEINGEVYKVEISAENKQHGISAENIELEEVSCVD